MATVYEIITDQIIEKLESGTIPWKRPWHGGEAATNLISKKPYRGINVFLLACSGYASPYWLSFNQVKKLGGHVRKGEKSTMITFWKINTQSSIDEETGESKTSSFPLLRYYRIFNVEQCEGEGIDKKVPVSDNIQDDFEPIEVCEQVKNGMPNAPKIVYKEQRAYYCPGSDFVNMPKQATFDTDQEYYSTLFHELTHSTGHKDRLNRDTLTTLAGFGTHEYSKEELVAEMGSAFLCGHCGIENETLENSAAYIKGWLKKLRNDPKMVVHAAGKAQKAADYILDKIKEVS